MSTYSEEFQHSNKRVKHSKPLKVLSQLLAIQFVILILLLVFIPWQQTAMGRGRVISYAPEQRQQNIDSPIDARILRWYVQEGAKVKKGDLLVDLTDNDADILARLRSERDAIEARVKANLMRAKSTESRIDALRLSQKNAISASGERVKMAEQRVSAAIQAAKLAKATLQTAQINSERQKKLLEQGLISTRQLELTLLEETKASTEVERTNNALEAAKSEKDALFQDQQRVKSDANAILNDAQANLSVAEAEMANATAELARIEVRLARQNNQSITAPQDGYLLKIIANGQSGEMVKMGDVLAVIVPSSNDRAIELWISGNDMPLVQKDAAVRVQFEGWPAIQFSGWPSISIGTFAGKVAFVDASDNGKGQFRIFVVPQDPKSWPNENYLRQGVRAHGFVQLGQVALGYELWRQFNGFPPVIAEEIFKQSTKEAAK